MTGAHSGPERHGPDREDPDRERDARLAERFEQHRGRLRAVAYRMLGSLEEADDAVQEAWVRCSAAGADDVQNLGGWLTTIVTRVCLNVLRARTARPVTLAGPHAPDAGLAAQRAVIDAFFAAARTGDLAALAELLDPDVVLRTDGFAGAPAVLRGAGPVARAAAANASPHAELCPVVINGAAGLLIRLRGRPAALMAFTVAGGRITAVDGITDPHRVARLAG